MIYLMYLYKFLNDNNLQIRNIIIIFEGQNYLKMDTKNLMKAYGLKATPQRRAVYEVLGVLGPEP